MVGVWRSKDKSAFDTASLTVSVSLLVSCRFPNLLSIICFFDNHQFCFTASGGYSRVPLFPSLEVF